MSVIVAARYGDHMWMAADRQINWGSLSRTDQGNFSKMIRYQNAYIGYVGSILFGTALSFCAERNPAMFEAPFESRNDVLAFFMTYYAFLSKEFGLGKAANNEVGKIKDASFLVVTPQAMFQVTDNRDVTQFDNYAAIGSGSKIAYGVMYALYGSGEPLESILTKSVNGANAFTNNCGGEVELINVAQTLGQQGPSELSYREPALV